MLGFTPNVIGLCVPLLVGLIGIGIYMVNQERHRLQEQKPHRPQERRRRVTFCDDSCPICLEEMNYEDSSPLNCGHMLHNTCIVEMNKRNERKCPQCRAEIIYY